MRCFTFNTLEKLSRADGADESGPSFRGSPRLQVEDGSIGAPLGAHGVRSPSWVLPCLAPMTLAGGGYLLDGEEGSTAGSSHTREVLSGARSSLSTGRRKGAESPRMRVAFFVAASLHSVSGRGRVRHGWVSADEG